MESFPIGLHEEGQGAFLGDHEGGCDSIAFLPVLEIPSWSDIVVLRLWILSFQQEIGMENGCFHRGFADESFSLPEPDVFLRT